MTAVEFIRHTVTGTVHVAVPTDDCPAWWERMYRRRPLWRDLIPPDNPGVWMAMQPVPCRCGLLAVRPSDGTRFAFVSVFDDADLCRSCYRATPPEDRVALFESEPAVDLDALGQP